MLNSMATQWWRKCATKGTERLPSMSGQAESRAPLMALRTAAWVMSPARKRKKRALSTAGWRKASISVDERLLCMSPPIATGATEDEDVVANEELLMFLFLFCDCANATSTLLVWSPATGRAFSMGVRNAPPTKNAGATSRP